MRLFVALDIPEPIRVALTEFGAPLQNICHAAEWVRLGGAHLTLKFIGQVQPEQGQRIQQTLAAVHAAPFDLHFAGLGFFPSERRPRVFWAGVEAVAPLATLAAAIEDVLEPLGIPHESRDFHPHITLARFTSAEGLGRLREALDQRTSAGATVDFGTARAAEFYLCQSVLKPKGAEYTRLSAYPLSGESSL